MKIVIDANIIIAMLIKPGKPITLFLNELLDIYSPEQLFKELERNKKLIITKSGLKEGEIDRAISTFKERINTLPEKKFLQHRQLAEKLCPCPQDISYFALALYLNCPIWSNEKQLKKQSKVKIYATHELIRLLNI